jgi:hypothetical protein
MARFTQQFRTEWFEHIALEHDAGAQGYNSLCSRFRDHGLSSLVDPRTEAPRYGIYSKQGGLYEIHATVTVAWRARYRWSSSGRHQ